MITTNNIKSKKELINFLDKNLKKIDEKYIDRTQYKSIRWNNKIQNIIIHTSAADDIQTVKIGAWMTSRQVSYQFAVLKDQDKTYKLLSDKYIWWHAGDNDIISAQPNSWWKDRKWNYNMNPVSIWIEIVNRQNKDIVKPHQIEQAIAICLDYMIYYNIPVSNVYWHFEISSQKHDPYQNWTKEKITTGTTNRKLLKPEMDEFRKELDRLLKLYKEEKPEKKYQNEIWYELFNNMDDNYETKKLIEIGIYRFVEWYKNKTLKIRK